MAALMYENITLETKGNNSAHENPNESVLKAIKKVF